MVQLAITVAIVATLGIVAFFLVGRKPEFFWPLLIGLPLVSSGFMIAGQVIVDKYFLATVLAGGFFAAKRGLVSLRTGEKTSPHFWVFLFTVLYFVLQSVRGTILLEDVRILRWVGYFLLFGVLLLLVRKWRFPLPNALSAAKITSVASSIYFGVYVLLGLFHECALGIFRWVPQGMLWAGSLYAVFPIIFSFPAGLFLLKSDDKRARWLGWLTIFTTVLAVGYYESRIGWLVLFGMLLFVPLVLGFRRALSVAPGLAVIFGFVILFSVSALASPYCNHVLSGKVSLQEALYRLFDLERYGVRLNDFQKGISATVIAPVSPRVSDVDRTLHIKAGFLVSTETPLRFLFGSGTHSHRSLLRPSLEKLYQAELPGTEIGPIVRTVGLSAILVDFGLVGFVLILSNLVFVMRVLVAAGGWLTWRRASILLAVLLIIPLWLSAGDIQTMVVYFLALMPENIFTLLVRDS